MCGRNVWAMAVIIILELGRIEYVNFDFALLGFEGFS